MSLTEEQNDLMLSLTNAAQEEPEKLNDWEKGFWRDQADRYEQYGEGTRFSEKQWAIVLRIAEKYGL